MLRHRTHEILRLPLPTLHFCIARKSYVAILGAFEKLRKTTISFVVYVLSVRPSVRNNLAATGRSSVKLRVSVKSVPLQAWRGPEGSRKLRFPDFVTTAQGGGKVVSPTHRPFLPLRKYSWYSFLLEAELTPEP